MLTEEKMKRVKKLQGGTNKKSRKKKPSDEQSGKETREVRKSREKTWFSMGEHKKNGILLRQGIKEHRGDLARESTRDMGEGKQSYSSAKQHDID